MAEDWRLTAELHDEGRVGPLLDALRAREGGSDAGGGHGRLAVSATGSRVFVYADSESSAREAQTTLQELAADDGVEATFHLDRWHHEEERWEDASVPLPSTEASVRVERERLEAEEAAESAESGVAEWEVRIELATHRDAHALAERLRQEGLEPVARWKFLLVGAADEDDANALAARLQTEAPAGSTVQIEPGGGLAWQLAPGNPYAVFGGLGG